MPLAAPPGQHPLGPCPATWAASSTAATPRSRAWSAHSRSVSATPSVSSSPPSARLGGGLAEEHRGRRGPDQPAAVRLLEGLEQAQPVVRGRRGEDVGVAGVDGRDPGRRQRVAAGPRVAVAPRRSRRRRRRRPGGRRTSRPQASSALTSAARSRAMCVADRRPSGWCGCRVSPNCLPGHHPQPERRRCAARRRAGVPGGGPSTSRTTMSSWPRAAPREHRLQAVDQRLRRCASWCRGCAAASAVLAGLEVGDDVAAAERVDRLLGVADQHQGGVAGEGALDAPATAPGRCPGTRRPSRSDQRRRIRSRAGASSASRASARRLSRSS